MKRRLLLWVPLAAVGFLVLSCAPSAPLKAPAAAPTPAAAALQESRPAAAQGFSPSTAPPGAPAPAAKPAPPPGGAPGEQRAVVDRMIIYNAQVSLEVKDVTDSLEAIAEIAQRQGGFVVGSSFRYEGERKVASVTIRVPALAYQATLAELRRLALKLEEEASKSQDVTEEYTDLKAQLGNLEATEAQYLELLKRAGTIDEILKVQARLSETRRDIERLKGRILYLERTSDMASITISLFSRDKAKAGPKEEPVGWWKSPGEAWEQSLVFLGRVASAIAIGVAFFWWALVVVAAVGLAVWRAAKGRTGT